MPRSLLYRGIIMMVVVVAAISTISTTAATDAAAFAPSYAFTRRLHPIETSLFHLSANLLWSVPDMTHIVDGIECREVHIEISALGSITILEATAQAQEDLVNLALDIEDDTIESTGSLLNAGDPYGAVLWPAASAIADHLVRNVENIGKLVVLEVGAGTGLVSLAASKAGASRVLATDYETVPLKLLEYAHKHLNPSESAATPIETALFDLCDESTFLPEADLVVAADIMYEPKTGRAMARRAVEALKRNSRVLIGDSPGRAGRPAFLEALKELGVHNAKFVDTVGRTCSGPRHELICGTGSTSVSETPQELTVAILDLDPSTCFHTS